MLSFGRKKISRLTVDLHSHLIPNIDDGSQSLAQSIEMIQCLKKLGVKKIITTPHIHPRYPNTVELIMSGLDKLQNGITKSGLEIEIEVAAEYFVDEIFQERVQKGKPILSFGDRYVLIEAPFQNKPIFFESVVFDLQSKGFQPVLAHPERYRFLEGRLDWLEDLKQMGVYFQLTLGSIGGYYGTIPAKIGSLLLKRKMVDFLGSDLHRYSHLKYFEKGLEDKKIRKALEGGMIKNEELL